MMSRVNARLFFTIWVAGLALTAWGLWHSVSTTELLQSWSDRQADWVVVAAAFLACWAVSELLSIPRLWAGVLIGATLALASGNAWPTLVVLAIGVASVIVGGLVLGGVGRVAEAEFATPCLLLGLLAYGTLVGISAQIPVAYVGTYALAVGLPLALGWRTLLATVPWRTWLLEQDRGSLVDGAIAALGLYYVLIAFMPEVGHDALVTHLFVPAQMSLRHRWGFEVQTYAWAVMPMLGDWLYSLAYVLGGETGSRLVNVAFILIICKVVADSVRWAGGDSKASKWAVLLFLATPLTFTEASSLFIESIWSAFVLAASLSILKTCGEPSCDHGRTRLHILLAGLFIGGALSAKAVTFTVLPALCTPVFVHFRDWRRTQQVRTVAVAVLLAGLVGAIPYIRAWHITGNPVFPFFNNIFRSPYWPAVAFQPPAIFEKGVSWDVLYRVTFESPKYLEGKVGASGFQWLLCVVPAVLIVASSKLRSRSLWLFLFAAVSVFFTFHATAYLRYVFPAFAWTAAGIGSALTASAGWIRLAAVASAAFSVVLNLAFFDSGTYYGRLSLCALTGPAEREAYLQENLPIRTLVEPLNALNSEGGPVAVFAPPLMAGLKADALYANWYNPDFEAAIDGANSADQFKRIFHDRGVRYLVLDSSWGTPAKRQAIRTSSEHVAQLESVELRQVQEDFATELLPHPGMLSAKDWRFPSGPLPQLRQGELIVSVASPAILTLPVSPRRRYMVTVDAKCPDGANQGRIQVNWLGVNSTFLKASIQVFDCSPLPESHASVFSAPEGAVQAALYATGHTDRPIVITGMSFRK